MRASLRNSFITGLLVSLPLMISAAILVWFFGTVDRFFSPPIDGIVGFLLPEIGHIPGMGILTGLAIILLVGLLARNVAGGKVIAALERAILRIPVFRTVYATVKQLTEAFSPDTLQSFKEVVLVEYPKEGTWAIGFRTASVEKEGEHLAAVYVPTNHLYIGEVLFYPEGAIRRLEMGVEQAVRIIVSGGLASPRHLPLEESPPLDNLSPPTVV